MTRTKLIFGNIISFIVLSFIIFLTATSCREQKPKTETIIIEKTVEKPVQQPKADKSDGTSLTIDKDGVGFSTKDGSKKTEIIIKD